MKHRILIILTILLCILAGCGREEEPSQATLSAGNKEERPADGWREGEWKFDTLSKGGGHDLYVTEYVQGLRYEDEILFPYGPEESITYFAGNNIYELDIFYSYTISEESSQPVSRPVYYLNCYDSGTGEIWHRKLKDPTLKEYPGKQLALRRMDIFDGGEYVLYLDVRDADNEMVAYVALRRDSNDKFLSATDLYPAMKENGIDILDNYSYTKAYTDQQGYFYLLYEYNLTGIGEGEILVIGPDGDMVERIGSDASGVSARYVMNDPDGNAVFEVYDSGEQQLGLWGYHAADGRKLYAQVQLEKGMPMAMSSEGYVYYGTQMGCLYRWDLYTGNRELCMDYNSMGMDPWRIRIGIGSSGEPLLLQESNAKPLICWLGTEPVVPQESIRVLCIIGNSYITKCAADYSLDHADCPIQVESLEFGSTWEDQRARALVDLVAGKGVDIYYVPMEDLDMLYEKGALADLTDVLPEEYKEAIYAGALELGTIDGKLVGLAPLASVSTMVVDRTLWQEDHWTLKEALELKERYPDYQLMGNWMQKKGYGNTLSLYLYNLADSPFLDLEAGTCDFMDPLFIQVLELIKEEESRGSTEEQHSIAFEQKIESLVYYNHIVGAYHNKIRSEDNEEYGYPYYLVGYPTENGMGSYWDSGSCVVVNRNTEHWEQIKEFLVSLYDYDRQRSSLLCVRRDTVEGEIKRVTDDPRGEYTVYGSGFGWLDVYENPEGGIWMEEYIEFMDSCKSRPRGTTEIANIITEEADSFFAGDKDARTVAELIQNRVQLYLNERSR